MKHGMEWILLLAAAPAFAQNSDYSGPDKGGRDTVHVPYTPPQKKPDPADGRRGGILLKGWDG